MFASRKNFLKSFAPVSLGIFLGVAHLSAAKTRSGSADTTATARRQSASAQFARAEEQQAALNAKPSEKRTLADYKLVVASYRRVALISPHAVEVPDSLLAAAELYTEMGDRFGRTYYQAAVDSYQILLREYPRSAYCQEAMLRIAKLQRDQLGETALARKTYEEFLKRYPRSPKKREVQEAVAELALLQNAELPSSPSNRATVSAAVPAATEEPRATTPSHSGGKATSSAEIPRVQRIRAVANSETARVTIDLEDSVLFTSGRIANPDRIFFDLRAARLTPEAARSNIHVEGGLLTAVRIAQYQAGVVRVVLDVNGVKEYAASLGGNPPRLLIDLYGNPPAAPLRAANAKREPAPKEEANAKPVAANGEGGAAPKSAAKNPAAEPASIPSAEQSASSAKSAASGSAEGNSSATVARNSLPSAKNGKSKASKATPTRSAPDLVQPASTPQPTRDGQSTLTRTLGLKVGRIVIDPGHGGHDTGTIGPTGLMEKDLCLDVALRLGKIIEQRLPGVDVIYTRSDDSFIPLEERTNIANQAKADLFISIHANSSRDHGARGIETYYLNLQGSAEAMEVAARENATAQEGVHELQDLVKRIARTEKIDESREFAEDVQDSLSKRIQKSSRSVRNRGVRKAPFVVLIGADMPSVLTEISFLSNPADERLLKKPEQRQKVAEGLYQGVVSYLQNINSVAGNLAPKPGAARPSATAAVEQSRNQR